MTAKPDNASIDPCWRRIGVWGDASARCTELDTVIHCHNCDVFTRTARELFERRPKPELQPIADAVRAEATSGSRSAVVFQLGGHWLALPTRVVQTVALKSPVHSLPHRKGTVVRGLVTVHGEILTCLSLSVALGLKRLEKSDDVAKGIFERIVVTALDDMRFAFRVNAVRGIHRFDPEQLHEPGEALPDAVSRYVSGIVDAVLDSGEAITYGCLDPERLYPALETALL